MESSPPAAEPSVELRATARAVVVRDPRAFGAEGSELAHLFLRRVFAVGGVRSIALDRVATTATIRYDRDEALAAIAAALRGSLTPLDASAVPHPGPGCWTIHRHAGKLSTVQVLADAPGRLRVRLPESVRAPERLLAVEARLANLPGVAEARVNRWTAGLKLAYDPAVAAAPALIAAIENISREVSAPERAAGIEAPEAVPFGVSNTTLGVAVAGEALLPILSPVSAALLLGTNVSTFRQAAGQLKRGEVGLPVLYTTIVGTTLLSGQFVASAAMSWMFRYWKQRTGDDLQRERLRLADRLRVEASHLRPGDRVEVEAGEVVPADGRVESGAGLVDERALAWGGGVGVRGANERVVAGSMLRGGRLRLRVERTGASTRAAAVGRLLETATRPSVPVARRSPRPERYVVPTLATAGVGLFVGGLATAGAVLRPDYATGPGVAGALETLRGVASGLGRGVLLRQPSALAQLADCGVIVLDDQPALRHPGLELALVQSPLPETDAVLRYAASAARQLADDRASALAAACRAQSIPLLRLDAEEEGDSIVSRHGRRHLRLYELPAHGEISAPLGLEVDGTFVGTFRFRRARRLPAASVVARLRSRTKAPIVLLSNRPGDEVAALAAMLGVDQHLGGLSTTDTARFLDDCTRRGLRPAWVGDARAAARLAPLAHVAIGHAADLDVDLDACPAAVLLLTPGMEPLADLWELAAASAERLREAERLVFWPNLLCVAGAFTMGFTSLTTVVISNIGTYHVYRRTSAALREHARRHHGAAAPAPRRDDGAPPAPSPRTPRTAGATRVVASA